MTTKHGSNPSTLVYMGHKELTNSVTLRFPLVLPEVNRPPPQKKAFDNLAATTT